MLISFAFFIIGNRFIVANGTKAEQSASAPHKIPFGKYHFLSQLQKFNFMQQEAKREKKNVNYSLFSVQSLHICMCSSLSDCIHMDLMVLFSVVGTIFIINAIANSNNNPREKMQQARDKKRAQRREKLHRKKNASSELNKTMKIYHWMSLIFVS